MQIKKTELNGVTYTLLFIDGIVILAKGEEELGRFDNQFEAFEMLTTTLDLVSPPIMSIRLDGVRLTGLNTDVADYWVWDPDNLGRFNIEGERKSSDSWGTIWPYDKNDYRAEEVWEAICRADMYYTLKENLTRAEVK